MEHSLNVDVAIFNLTKVFFGKNRALVKQGKSQKLTSP